MHRTVAERADTVQQAKHLPTWPENPHNLADRAIAPLIESGEGEAEGFELSEADLIPRRRAHDEPEIPRLDDDRYGAGVDEDPET
jgi:hypothetical protein